MRRLLFCWLEGPRINKISAGQVAILLQNLVGLRPYIPEEFARRHHSLSEARHWKATEFRQFLLYRGPHILKDFLRPELYAHFMKFSVAMSLLLLLNLHNM